MPERAGSRTFGWREVLLVGGAIVVLVLGLAFLTSLLPNQAQWVIFQSPLLIALILVGTVAVLASLMRGGRPH